VRAGDTPERIAAEYYGNRALEYYIREVNQIARGAKLKRGRRLQVPTAFRVKLKKNQTLEVVAKRYLGDARRAPFLAEWSGINPGDKPAEGAELLVPFQFIYRPSTPQTLTTIAKSFYNDTSQARMLAGYNFRKEPQVARGEKIIVPLPHLRVRSVYLPQPSPGQARSAPQGRQVMEEASERESQRREAELANRVAERLRLAEKAYRDGSYDEVPAQLVKLLAEEDPSEAQLISIHRLLGFAYVALGTESVAVKEFQEVLERDPNATLDPVTVSPKILRVFERARQER
jgi:hypothetical protein